MTTFTRGQLYEYWVKGIPLFGNMIVHRMSYGDYFLEPQSWQGGERAGFSPATIWPELIDAKKQLYSVQ